jgi:purine-binding chemotaxis protein CheW
MRLAGDLILFSLDERRFALPLRSVERVVRAVDITPLPDAPQMVLGVIDVQGEIVSVINLRRRCRMPERELQLTDQSRKLMVSYRAGPIACRTVAVAARVPHGLKLARQITMQISSSVGEPRLTN